MKPKLNRTIYSICTESYEVYQDTVGYLGENSFIVKKYEFYDYNYEFKYEDFNKTWFTSFSKAKSTLRKLFNEEYELDKKFKLVEVRQNDYWRVEENV